MIEDVPIFRVKVSTATDVLKVNALNPNTQIRTTGSVLEATIEDIHEVLVVDY